MRIDDLPPTLLRVFAVLFGLLWGSFLNVVIYRVPRDMSVVRPPSHCPGCGAPVKPYDNIPLVSFALLGGRARCCKTKMSWRYPLVEAIGGLLSLAILEAVVFRLEPATTLARGGAIFVADFALALGLVATAFIDLEFMIVPRAVTFGGALVGVATSSFREITFVEALIGAAVGYAVVWLPFIVIFPRIRGGKMGMAHGDADLLMLAGAWFGWQGALFTLGAAAVQGTLVTVALLATGKRPDDPEVVKREREELEKDLAQLSPEDRAREEAAIADDPLYGEAEPGIGRARIAFGPFLSLTMLECMLFGREAMWNQGVEAMDRVVRAVAGWFGG